MRLAIVLAVLAATSLPAQAPEFAGTWGLDETKSNVVAAAGIVGLIPAGAPKTLHITQPSNGTLVIESQINEAHVRIYKPGRETSTPAGQGGSVTMTTTWAGRTVTSEGAVKNASGELTNVKEVWTLSGDGQAITLQTTVGANTSTMVYTKITDVGPCEKWPTPCKRFP
ncbi:MAG TPA: hypothetical protein VJ691_14970 [Vicinamibacterales bacterium]|nr:hypothetical protein [Vicinamibacterales bacterium]